MGIGSGGRGSPDDFLLRAFQIRNVLSFPDGQILARRVHVVVVIVVINHPRIGSHRQQGIFEGEALGG